VGLDDQGELMEIRADLTANVWKLEVSEGQQVVVGDTLVILESMKMEIPIEAIDAGTVKRLGVEEGGLVHEGDVIAVIE